MDINRMLHEIWEHDIHWQIGKDILRGVYMRNTFTRIGLYGNNVEDVIRKVWLMTFGKYDEDVGIVYYGMEE